MTVGAQFSRILIDLRAELRRPSDISVGVDDVDSLKRVVNSVYITLLDEFEWPHLRTVFDKIPMVAGQRVYDYQPGFDPDNVEEAAAWIGPQNYPIHRRITMGNYSFIDPATNQRMDPPLAWDTKYDITSGTSQIEVFPLPASNSYSIQFIGIYKPGKLVNDNDICHLDDELVLGESAAQLLTAQDSKDAEIRANRALRYGGKKKSKSKNAGERVQMGLGTPGPQKWQHPNIVIAPRS
jgi:hypothetical protein